MPKIAVILPVFNGSKYLDLSVQSVLKQNIKDFEFIICDDSSTDESFEIINQINLEYHNKIRLLKNEMNQGLFKTLNRLILESSAPLIHLWSQDDIMKPNCLRECLSFHEKHPEISMSYHGVDYIDDQGKEINFNIKDGTPEVISTQLYANISVRWGCIAGNIANVTLNHSFINKVGLFNEDMVLSGDFEFWTRLAAVSSIGRNPKKLIELRSHTGQLSKNYKSVYRRIKEDIPIQMELLNLLHGTERTKALGWWKWKTQVAYLNDLFFLKRKGENEEAKKLHSLIKQKFNQKSLIVKWVIIRFLRLTKLEIGFYKKVIDR